jgi:hypothetical protein
MGLESGFPQSGKWKRWQDSIFMQMQPQPKMNNIDIWLIPSLKTQIKKELLFVSANATKFLSEDL